MTPSDMRSSIEAVALAIEAPVKTDPGTVAFFNAADLKLLHLVKVTPQLTARLTRSTIHDGEQTGMGNHINTS